MNFDISQKRLVQVLAIFCLPTFIFTKNLQANEGLELEAKSELHIKLKRLSSFQTEFSQSITDLAGNELQSSSGTLALQKPNQLRWETITPDETLLIADGTTVWNVDPFVEQVTVMAQDMITQNNPLMLLVSDSEEQWNSVSVESVEFENIEAESSGSKFKVISLDENPNVVSLIITFKNDQLVSLKSTDRQQQQSLLIFTNSINNEVLTKDYFLYAVPSNYIIDDQRSQ
ncbi:MAG: outer membrane lipoprotein carrier protein [Glaciecola sp.]|jgi:outer membrane lipoprotein carrier protein